MATGTILLAIEGGSHDDSVPAGRDWFNSLPRLRFDDAVDEIHHYTFRMPENFASALVLKAFYAMSSATSGNVILATEVMAFSDGDAADITAESYDTVNTSSATAVPGTAGHPDEISLTLSNDDSVGAGDWVAIRFRRDANNGSDTATGDLELYALSLEYTTT